MSRHQAVRGIGTYLPCEVCSKQTYASPKQAAAAKFRTCSKECRSEYSSRKVRTVVQCGSCGKDVTYRKCDLKRIKSPSCSFECALNIRSTNLSVKKQKGMSKEQMNFAKRVGHIKYRALKKGFEFDLDYLDLEDLYNRQQGKCFYTGLQMSLEKTSRHNNSMALSVDRVDPSLGYTRENVVLCLNCINAMKNNMDFSQFKAIADSLASHLKALTFKKEKK